MQRFSKKEVAIIVLFFVFYMIGYAWLIEPKAKSEKKTGKETMIQQPEGRRAEKRQTKSLSAGWPLDLGKYFYTIDIAPGYEMENEEYEVIRESGGNLIVRKHNDWPDISGHFEWYCKSTTTGLTSADTLNGTAMRNFQLPNRCLTMLWLTIEPSLSK